MNAPRINHYRQVVLNQHGEELMIINSQAMIPLIGERIELDDGHDAMVYDVTHRYPNDTHIREISVEVTT